MRAGQVENERERVAANINALRAEVALGELVDALNDDLAYEVSKSPEVQRKVRAAITVLGDPYKGYLDAWWLS